MQFFNESLAEFSVSYYFQDDIPSLVCDLAMLTAALSAPLYQNE